MNQIEQSEAIMSTSTTFRLNKTDAKFMGVCSGIAETYGLDVTLVRLGFALGTLLGFGSLILVYLAIGLIAD